MSRIEDLFRVESGSGAYRKNVDEGETPLISATTENNGVLALVDIEPTFTAPAITVERVSGKAHVQVKDFATVPDDMSVLKPKVDMSLKELFEVAAQINSQRWRYSYSRKLTPTRLALMEVNRKPSNDDSIESVLTSVGVDLPAMSTGHSPPVRPPAQWKAIQLGEHFSLQHGDFNALPKEEGSIPTVSRSSTNNGIVGYFERPDGAAVYDPPRITVSTVSGKAFVQLNEFIVSDKVVILTPKNSMSLAEMYFFQAMIDYQAWRYSYGRSCFKSKLRFVEIYLPFDRSGDRDIDFMESVVRSTSYWEYVESEVGWSDFEDDGQLPLKVAEGAETSGV